MGDFVEVDFLDVETDKSGDAIALRYSINGVISIHIVDGGFSETTPKMIEHIEAYYGNPKRIDNVVLTHADMDHANGLRGILEHFEIGTLWMNRPWLYAEELIDRFGTYQSIAALRGNLRSSYKAAVELETIAEERGISIREAFQGEIIGAFTVMAPSRERYLDMIVASPKTPDGTIAESATSLFAKILKGLQELVAAPWGHEFFPLTNTGPENETSVVQYGLINGKKILLTGDTGRDGLTEAADFAPTVNLALPGVDCFQVPHHGGRHNVNTTVIDRWLGERLQDSTSATTFMAICSSAEADKHHPKKAVVRAMLHRGARFAATEGRTISFTSGISRSGWVLVEQAEYPTDQEEY